MGKVITICGLIGSGKSTLGKELTHALGANTLWLPEPDEKGGRNPYLADYYKDPKRFALTMQLHLLGVRYRMHLQAQWYAMNTGNCAVMDSSYWQDTAFARLQKFLDIMSDREFETYRQIYHAMTASVLLPTVCIRILVDPTTCSKRIAKRMEKETGRSCEQSIDLDYLVRLDAEIDHMVAVLRHSGVAILDVPYDVDRDTEDQRELTVKCLASRILSIEPPDLFLDLHRRTI